MAQFIEHDTGNQRDTDSSPTLGIDRQGPPIHPEAKWVPGIWTRMAL